MPDAIVIGAGPNGLIAANLLADAGWDVVVLERADEPGGAVRSGETCEPGFVHDRFSSFYPFAMLSPSLRALALEDHGLRWRRSPDVVAHVRPDGTGAVLHGQVEETCAALEAEHGGDGTGWRVLMDRWRRVEPGFRRAFFTPFPPVLGAARLGTAVHPRDLVRLARFAALGVRRMGDEHFGGRGGPDLLAGNALHADLGPEAVGSGMFGWILCGLGQRHGFPVPEGGASRLTEALVRRLRAAGGQVRCGAPVTRIVVRGARARAVRLGDGGEEVVARRAILADVDAVALYEQLVGREHLSRRVLSDLDRFQRDSSTVKVDWSLDAPVPWVAHGARRAGTVHLAGDVDELTMTMAELATRRLPSRPFLVMGQYSMTDPTRQPDGRETLWAYTHVPHDARGDAGGELSGAWRDGELERFVARMEDRIEACAPGFRGLVRQRAVAAPWDLAGADANLVDGAINGGTANVHQLAVFRPIPAQLGRPLTSIGDLYLASSSAHPAGGVHGAPGTIAARAALLRHTPAAAVRAGAIRRW